MAKRLYHPTFEKIFQYKEGGNFYFRHGDTDFCLKTTDVVLADKRRKAQEDMFDTFGVEAYKIKTEVLFPEFLKKKKKEVRSRTFKLYNSIWETYLEPKLGKYPPAKIQQPVWEKFCASTKGVSDFQNHKNLLHQFFVWCAMNGKLKAIPILKNPKHKRRKRKIIPPQHLKLIFGRAHGSLLLFSSMALFMGMRRAEIMTLSWDRVDFDGRSLWLRDQDVKTGEGRQVPLNSVVYGLLVQRLKEQQDAKLKTMWVFPNKKSPKRHASLEGLMTAWRWCLLDCGLAMKAGTEGRKSKYKIVVDYTWHDFRATYEKASHLSKDYTDTQKEKMVGADISVQKRIYVSMGAEDLRGLEEVVTNQIPELTQIIENKTTVQKVQPGNGLGNGILKSSKSGATNG